jgi:hypothetical protein
MMGFLIKAIMVITITTQDPNCHLPSDYVSSSPKPHCEEIGLVGQSISKRDQPEPADHQINDSSGAKAKEQGTIDGDGTRIYVHSKTIFLKAATLEAAVRKHDEFLKSGYLFTTDSRDADVVIEIDRAPFTTEFPYSIVDPRTHLVIGSGKVNSIGGTVAGKISIGFIKQMPAINAAIQK